MDFFLCEEKGGRRQRRNPSEKKAGKMREDRLGSEDN